MKRTIHNPIHRDMITFIRTCDQWGGPVTELDATVIPGGGNPSHFHRPYDEAITVLEGTITMELAAGVRRELSPGESHLI